MKTLKIRGKEYAQQQTRAALDLVVNAFKTGDVPKAIANAFLLDASGIPMAEWSRRNRALAVIQAMALKSARYDARSYNAWKRVGRTVKKGEKSIKIFKPWTIKKTDEETGEERYIVIGFVPHSVFDYSQTEGEELPEYEAANRTIEEMPLVNVARNFGLEVSPGITQFLGAAGYFDNNQDRVAMGVANVSTFLHELVHAAEAKSGIKMVPGQDPAQEITAEVGGAVLATILGMEYEADLGGAYEYVERYAKQVDAEPHKAVLDLTTRIINVVEFILDKARELAEPEAEAVPA